MHPATPAALPIVQRLNHRDKAVAAQILAVLRPAAAQEAQWLGLAASPLSGTEPESGGRSDSDDLADICASPQLHLGAWLAPLQARQAGVADPRTLAAVLRLVPDDSDGPPGRLCISLLVVAPWAQRRGLARALVQAALQQGPGWGFSVTAARANTAALALYQGLGFVPGRQGLLGAGRLPVVQLLRAPELPLPATTPGATP